MSNKEILERFYSNEKIVEKNPIILKELSTTFETLGEEDMFRYEKLLEVVEFDRVVACARFVVLDGKFVMINESDKLDVPKDVYFSRWEDENF